MVFCKKKQRKIKIQKKILWAVLEGCMANPANQPISEKLHEIWNFFWPNEFIWSAWEYFLVKFIPKVPLAPSKCLSKWIKVDKWDYFQNDSQDFFSLFYTSIYIYFFEYETIGLRHTLLYLLCGIHLPTTAYTLCRSAVQFIC